MDPKNTTTPQEPLQEFENLEISSAQSASTEELVPQSNIQSQQSRGTKEEAVAASSVPSPKLGSPSMPAGSSASGAKPSLSKIKVFNEDGSSQVLEVPSDITARDLCQLCITKNRCAIDSTWTIFEQLSQSGIERIVEDHESVVRVQSSWAMDTDCRFYFRKKSGKYDFFRNLTFFPEHMVSICHETKGGFSHSQLIQDFMNPRACPEIHGHLQIKDQGKKPWKKYYFFLRRSGLYFSTKGTSKEPRHLQFIADLNENNVYTMLSGKKMYGAPTNFGFCLKLNRSGDAKDMKLLCADDEHSRTCWMTVVRLFKHGLQLYQNYKTPLQKSASSLTRSSSENSLVAMDFTGESGRVIDNPEEALSAAAEEALSWRKRACHRVNMHWSTTAQPISASSEAFHRIQPWFHHRISREESQKLMEQQGLMDGMYLVRESQSNLKNFVLSLCYGKKIRHFQIISLEEEGKVYYSLDEGHTKFINLVQLVEFFQLNKGMLPSRLKRHCVRVTL